MTKEKIKATYNFSEHEFPKVKLEKCSIIEYNPSQSENYTSTKSCSFIIVKDGKGTVTYTDKRATLTKGSGIVIPSGETSKFKADSIEPFTLIEIQVSGKGILSIISNIQNRENNNILNFGVNNKISDCAYDLIVECSKPYHSEFGILLLFYDFLKHKKRRGYT